MPTAKQKEARVDALKRLQAALSVDLHTTQFHLEDNPGSTKVIYITWDPGELNEYVKKGLIVFGAVDEHVTVVAMANDEEYDSHKSTERSGNWKAFYKNVWGGDGRETAQRGVVCSFEHKTGSGKLPGGRDSPTYKETMDMDTKFKGTKLFEEELRTHSHLSLKLGFVSISDWQRKEDREADGIEEPQDGIEEPQDGIEEPQDGIDDEFDKRDQQLQDNLSNNPNNVGFAPSLGNIPKKKGAAPCDGVSQDKSLLMSPLTKCIKKAIEYSENTYTTIDKSAQYDIIQEKPTSGDRPNFYLCEQIFQMGHRDMVNALIKGLQFASKCIQSCLQEYNRQSALRDWRILVKIFGFRPGGRYVQYRPGYDILPNMFDIRFIDDYLRGAWDTSKQNLVLLHGEYPTWKEAESMAELFPCGASCKQDLMCEELNGIRREWNKLFFPFYCKLSVYFACTDDEIATRPPDADKWEGILKADIMRACGPVIDPTIWNALRGMYNEDEDGRKKRKNCLKNATRFMIRKQVAVARGVLLRIISQDAENTISAMNENEDTNDRILPVCFGSLEDYAWCLTQPVPSDFVTMAFKSSDIDICAYTSIVNNEPVDVWNDTGELEIIDEKLEHTQSEIEDIMAILPGNGDRLLSTYPQSDLKKMQEKLIRLKEKEHELEIRKIKHEGNLDNEVQHRHKRIARHRVELWLSICLERVRYELSRTFFTIDNRKSFRIVPSTREAYHGRFSSKTDIDMLKVYYEDELLCDVSIIIKGANKDKNDAMKHSELATKLENRFAVQWPDKTMWNLCPMAPKSIEERQELIQKHNELPWIRKKKYYELRVITPDAYIKECNDFQTRAYNAFQARMGGRDQGSMIEIQCNKEEHQIRQLESQLHTHLKFCAEKLRHMASFSKSYMSATVKYLNALHEKAMDDSCPLKKLHNSVDILTKISEPLEAIMKEIPTTDHFTAKGDFGERCTSMRKCYDDIMDNRREWYHTWNGTGTTQAGGLREKLHNHVAYLHFNPDLGELPEDKGERDRVILDSIKRGIHYYGNDYNEEIDRKSQKAAREVRHKLRMLKKQMIYSFEDGHEIDKHDRKAFRAGMLTCKKYIWFRHKHRDMKTELQRHSINQYAAFSMGKDDIFGRADRCNKNLSTFFSIYVEVPKNILRSRVYAKELNGQLVGQVDSHRVDIYTDFLRKAVEFESFMKIALSRSFQWVHKDNGANKTCSELVDMYGDLATTFYQVNVGDHAGALDALGALQVFELRQFNHEEWSTSTALAKERKMDIFEGLTVYFLLDSIRKKEVTLITQPPFDKMLKWGDEVIQKTLGFANGAQEEVDLNIPCYGTSPDSAKIVKVTKEGYARHVLHTDSGSLCLNNDKWNLICKNREDRSNIELAISNMFPRSILR